MSREAAIQNAANAFTSGAFIQNLTKKIACQTMSEIDGGIPILQGYLENEIKPELTPLGFDVEIIDNPIPKFGPYLIAQRIENPNLPTVLMYGHGDVIRGQDDKWLSGTSPWVLRIDQDKIYGRGTADNKGQFTINTLALSAVIAERKGKLGFNVRIIFETGEETGSIGLNDFCRTHAEKLKANLFIASDGPRLNAKTPTLFLGSRGLINIELNLHLREGAHHSGNWGGLLRNPGTILASAIASLVNAQGQILPNFLKPKSIPESVKKYLSKLEVGGNPGDPDIDVDWGESNLTPAERVFGWNTLEVLAFECGNVEKPIGAIPPNAKAICQLRYVVGTDVNQIAQQLQNHFEGLGIFGIEVKVLANMSATRLNPEHPSINWVIESIQKSSKKSPAVLPNLGGTIPNDAFSEVLGIPTIWIPHSYPACSQHAPNEHLLGSVAKEGLEIMAGLFWDLGEDGSSRIWAK